MADTVEIPKGLFDSKGPCWIAIVTRNDAGVLTHCKPLIKCDCGRVCGIGLHHVHADGTVTRSFWHAKVTSFVDNGKTYQCIAGCGWHVNLKLLGYTDGDFPPTP